MSLVNQAVIVLVLGAIGWGGGTAIANNAVGGVAGAIGGGIAGLALCDWLRSRFRDDG